MLVWSPTNADVWFARPESDLSVLENIAISSDDSTVLSVTAALVSGKLPSQISLTSSITGVVFGAAHLDGLFPILSLVFLRNAVLGETFSWEDLPADAEDLILYRKDPIARKTFFVSVTATEDPASLTPSGTETKVYEFAIDANYSAGQARLVEEINARR